MHFVTESPAQSWILRPIAKALQTRIPGATIGSASLPSVDWNIFVNYALYDGVQTRTAALFTHRENDTFDMVADECTVCLAMSKNTLKLLPASKSHYLKMYPTDPRYYKPLKIGVCGRRYKSGRKRMWLAEEVGKLSGVEVKITGGKIKKAEMPSFYRSIDYLLVTSENEGGPMPVVEAISMGVPVIAPDVGFCWEYPVLKYETEEDLFALIEGLVIPRSGWNVTAEHLQRILYAY